MKEGRFRPSVAGEGRLRPDGYLASMKEGRFRPSFIYMQLDSGQNRAASMKEGRFRPSFLFDRSPLESRPTRPQ